MRHLKSGRRLNRTTSHRKAMLANLATSILDKERVTTTVAKAKEVRGVVERLITYGKRGGLAQIRQAAKTIHDRTVLKKLFDDIAPGYKEREGGYTRIVKIGERKGDNAEMSIIELVARNGDDKRKRRKKVVQKKKPVQPKSVKNADPAPAADESKPTGLDAPETVDASQDAADTAEKKDATLDEPVAESSGTDEATATGDAEEAGKKEDA